MLCGCLAHKERRIKISVLKAADSSTQYFSQRKPADVLLLPE